MVSHYLEECESAKEVVMMGCEALVDHYTYRVTWSDEDQEHVGSCVEFPSLSWLDKKPGKALAGIMQLVGDVVQDLLDNQEAVPEPIATKHYSGSIPFRTTPDIHRRLVLEAKEAGVSLNRLLNSRVASA